MDPFFACRLNPMESRRRQSSPSIISARHLDATDVDGPSFGARAPMPDHWTTILAPLAMLVALTVPALAQEPPATTPPARSAAIEELDRKYGEQFREVHRRQISELAALAGKLFGARSSWSSSVRPGARPASPRSRISRSWSEGTVSRAW